MLEKIVSIHNVSKFRDYDAKGDTSFRPTTLIYGENGRGKSTLAAILRSLTDNDPTCIVARKTLGVDEDPTVFIRASNSNFRFENGNWDDRLGNIAIFDSHFVNSNIFSGDHVTSDQRQALYYLVIGARGVELANHLVQLDVTIRDSSRDQQALERSITAAMPHDMAVADFLDLVELPNIDDLLQAKFAEIAALQVSAEIDSHPVMDRLSLPPFPIDAIATTIGTDLDVISADAEKAVSAHIAKMSDSLPQWIEQGVSFIDKHELEDCPFCGRPLEGFHLIEHYRQFFNAEYIRFKDGVRDLSTSIASAFGQTLLDQCSRIAHNNRTNNEFWRQHLAYDFPDIPFEELTEVVNSLRDAATNVLQRKARSPLDPIPMPDELTAIHNRYRQLIDRIDKLNLSIDAVNRLILDLKAKMDPSRMTAAKDELARLQNIQHRFQPAVANMCNDLKAKLADIDALRLEKESTRQQLDAYAEDTLGQYQTSINRFLGNSTDIQIVNVTTSHRGGRPRTEYQLSVNNVNIPLGAERVIDHASFTTTLSDGDKNSLAFAFFLALLEVDPDVSEKIVVIDDPITSLDRNRRTATSQEIVRLSGISKQLVVMSHDPHFLFDISSSISSPKHLQINRGQSGSEITEWEISETVKNELIRNYETLQDYARHNEGDQRLVAMTIRLYLEGYLRIKYPDEFLPPEWLGDFIAKIDSSSPGDSLSHLKGQLSAELNEIKDYSKQFHHDQNPNAASVDISEEELRKYVERTLELRKRL